MKIIDNTFNLELHIQEAILIRDMLTEALYKANENEDCYFQYAEVQSLLIDFNRVLK